MTLTEEIVVTKVNSASVTEQDVVKCMICEQSFKSLHQHIYPAHNVTLEEYTKMFPLSPTISLSTRSNISEQLKGRPKSEQHRHAISTSHIQRFKNGGINGNKGHTGYKQNIKNLAQKNKNISIGQKKNWDKNDHRRKLISDRMKGDKNPSKRPEIRKKISDTVLKLHQDPEYRHKYILGRIKAKENRTTNKFLYSQTEIKLYGILKEITPKCIHNGKTRELLIDHKCPDFFVPTNSGVKLIEMWGSHWHTTQGMKERKSLFNHYGFDTLFIWDYELIGYQDNLKEKIRKFVEGQ